MTRPIHLVGQSQRNFAKQQIDNAPPDYIVTIVPPTRSNAQNAKLRAMIGDIMKAKPEGHDYNADTWKSLLMADADHVPIFERSLDGKSMIPLGFRSSRLSVPQMSDLIEATYAYGALHGVAWSEPDGCDEARSLDTAP